jgi:hypothetical protein
MADHPLFEFFRSFSPGEMNSFLNFLNSPYHNKSRNVIKLFSIITKYYPEFKSDSLTKEKLYKAVYNNDSYNDSTFRNLTAGLLNLAQEFLVVQRVGTDTISSGNILLNELLLRNQSSFFTRNANRIFDDIARQGVDFQYLYNRYQLERNLFNFSIINDKITNKKNVYSHIENLTNSVIFLTIYYFTEIICGYLNFIIYSENFNTKDFANFMNMILESCDMKRIHEYLKDKHEYDFVLEIYLSLFYTFTRPEDDEEYFKYKALVEKHHDKLSRDELSFHYSKFISYCILKGVRDNDDKRFEAELFDLYNIILEKKLYANNKIGHLPLVLFRDILFLAVRIRKYDWLKKFVAKYSKKLHPMYIENMESFGYAYLLSETGDFDKALDYVNKISMDYFIFKYDVKNLRLKIYYELNYFEEALSLIHSYREFLRNNPFLSEKRKRRVRNFIKYLERLILLRSGSSRQDSGYLESQLSREENVTHKAWLLEKLGQLNS